MLNVTQFRELIIKPALLDLVFFGEDLSELLVFTCAVESNGGENLKQINGDALGIYKMLPDVYNNLWLNDIKNDQSLLMKLFSNFNINFIPIEDRIIYDLRYATAMAAIFYQKTGEVIPRKNDLNGVYEYYKKHYNKSSSAATKQTAISKYKIFINN